MGNDELRAGVVGLGMIGGGVAVSLATSGHPAAAVYDVRPEAADGLEGVPAPVGSPAAVAKASDVVLVAVNTAQQAHEVLSGDDGLLSGAEPGTHRGAALDGHRSRRCAPCPRCATSTRSSLLDAGVTGGTVAAKNGLVTMVGGPDEAVQRALPVLEAFSKNVVHCGPLGAGMATKLARNAITYAMWAAVREATSLAASAGVDPRSSSRSCRPPTTA